MKTLINLSLALAFLMSGAIYGQDVQGIATYKTQRKMDMELDSTQMDEAMRKQITAMMKKQLEKEYTLEFTKDESVYREVPKLDDANSAGVGGMVFKVEVVGSGASDVLYKNVKEGRFANQNEMFSKQFLIKDKIEAKEWTLVKETKNIGEYACFKAIHTYERPKRIMRTISSEDNKKEEDTTEAPVEEMETVTVTAWYTPQIPVANGPADFQGLPGLILELNDGELNMLCSKVVLNPKGGLSIKEPEGGKIVTQEKYDEIMDKKMKEMEEQFESDGRRKGNGNRMEIRIGG